jgi:NhaP-type Na+/H+ or K+/H+ antiporter
MSASLICARDVCMVPHDEARRTSRIYYLRLIFMYHWQFASRHERPQSWYIIALVVVLFLVIYGIVEGLYMMSIVAFLFAGVYIMKENNSTPLTDVEVNENGIQVQQTFYPYAQIASFAILYDHDIPKILRCSMKK